MSDRAERRIVVSMLHGLHTTMAVLLVVAVLSAWRAGERPFVSLGAALAIGVVYLLSRRGTLWLATLLVVWAIAMAVSPAFAWLAFPLTFLWLHGFRAPWSYVAVAVTAGWSAAMTGSLLGPVIGVLAASLVFQLFLQQRRDALTHRALVAELREAQAELAATERARGVLAERERLAREIHDTVGQGLASIVVLARTAQAERPDGPDQLALIESTARDNLAETRRLIRDLGTPGEVSLEESLRALAADTTSRAAAQGHPLIVEVAVEGSPRGPLDPRVADALRRGAQASVANIVQHAGATRARLGLGWFDDEVVLDIVDDGRGFDPDGIGPDSFGLRGLRARLGEVGGSVTVDSRPGEGTTVALTVPLAQPSANPNPSTQEAR